MIKQLIILNMIKIITLGIEVYRTSNAIFNYMFNKIN